MAPLGPRCAAPFINCEGQDKGGSWRAGDAVDTLGRGSREGRAGKVAEALTLCTSGGPPPAPFSGMMGGGMRASDTPPLR